MTLLPGFRSPAGALPDLLKCGIDFDETERGAIESVAAVPALLPDTSNDDGNDVDGDDGFAITLSLVSFKVITADLRCRSARHRPLKRRASAQCEGRHSPRELRGLGYWVCETLRDRALR